MDLNLLARKRGHKLLRRRHIWGAPVRFAAGLLLILIFVLSSCRPVVEQQPTLVPTLSIALPPTGTATLSPTPAADTATPAPTDTGTPVLTPTETITAWVQASHTPGPSPTATRTATLTRVPTRTRAPTNTPTITFTPTITLTPTPPAPALQLVRPGLMSKLISPIQMELYAITGAGGKVTVELIGEDGRVISRQVLDYKRPGRQIWITPELPFEIDAAAETARLQVSTLDEFNRLEWVSSTDVVLLGVGRNEITPSNTDEEPYLIRDPRSGTSVSGGLLVISALANPVNTSPLIIELVTEDGVAMSTKQIVVPEPTGDLSHTPFSVEIPYKVDGPTPVRLTIRQEGSRIPGNVALSSETITLLP